MPHTLTASLSGNSFGVSYTKDLSVVSDMAIPFSPNVDPPKNGTLTTRTDNNTGTLTMDAGHGINTGDILDLYWEDDGTGTPGHRRGMVVGTVATNSVPIDLGDGDNLPALDSVITAAVPHEEDLVVTGDNVVGITIAGPQNAKCIVSFCASDDSEIVGYYLEADAQEIWTTEVGTDNPMAGGAVAKVRISVGDDLGAAAAVSGTVYYN